MEANINELIAELKEIDFPNVINSSYMPIVDATNLLRQMIEDGGDYEATKETIQAVRDFELSGSYRTGEIASKYGALVNEQAVDNQGKFDLALGKALNYLRDIVNIRPVINEVDSILGSLIWLENGHALILAKNNFEKAGYNAELWKQMDNDIKGTYEIVNSNHESESINSNPLKGLDFNDQKNVQKYYEARDTDFMYLFTRYLPGNSFVLEPLGGRLTMTAERIAQVLTIDAYSEKVSKLIDKLDDIKVTLNYCEQNLSATVAIPKSGECVQMLEILKQLVLAVRDLGDRVLVIYDKFKNCDDDAPYCFMKKLPSLSTVSGYSLDSLNKDDPIKGGTHFADNYKKLCTSLVDYRKKYIRGFGLINF